MKKTLYFSSDAEFEAYYGASGKVPAGEIAVVGDYKKVYTSTNNIDGTSKDYEAGGTAASGSINITENGEGIDIAEYATANVNVPIPAGYIQPTGNYAITANGENIDIAQYATVSVNVAAPTPPYTWQTVSTAYPHTGADLYLEMNAGTTYIFKSSAGNVEMFLGQADVDGDGDVDMDDEFYPIGRMVPNKEYYLTATNEYVNTDSEHEYDQGKAYIFFGLNGGSSTIQYAVVS